MTPRDDHRATRDRQIIGLLAQGLTSDQIAQRLSYSVGHVRRVLMEMRRERGASTQAALVWDAVRRGELVP